MSDEALIYLLGDSEGRKRDMITQCYYEAAQGDPKSGPVVFAVLLNSCAEQFAKTPQELLSVVADFRKLLAEGREMEARIRERVELSNYGVVAEFKDETRRVMSAWRETIEQATCLGKQIAKMAFEMELAIATVRQIAQELSVLADDLKKHRESAKEIASRVELVKTIHLDNQALMKRLGKESRANWITIGLGFGMALAYTLDQAQAPLPAQLTFFLLAAGLIQGLSRLSWNYFHGQGKKTALTNKP